MKKIIAIGIVSIFLLESLIVVSAFKLEESGTKSNQSFIVTLDEYDAEISLNDVVSFEISVYDPNGEPASFYNYEVYTSPFEEDISCQRDGDKIMGEFTAAREGIYSLIVEITGVNNDVEKAIFYYFVNPTGIEKVRYYFRYVDPTHGQPTGNDAKSLLFAPPIKKEASCCSVFVQVSPDEIPENPVSLLTNIDINCWYVMMGDGIIGIQRSYTSGSHHDREKSVPAAENSTWINRNFIVCWPMTSPESWYELTVRFWGGRPCWLTDPIQPSYVDFTYVYTTTPWIKSIANTDVMILSATSQSENINNAEIILEGAGTTNLVVQMPDTSLIYSAKLNGVECDFTQVNEELTFNVQLDSEHSEHYLNIFPCLNSINSLLNT